MWDTVASLTSIILFIFSVIIILGAPIVIVDYYYKRKKRLTAIILGATLFPLGCFAIAIIYITESYFIGIVLTVIFSIPGNILAKKSEDITFDEVQHRNEPYDSALKSMERISSYQESLKSVSSPITENTYSKPVASPKITPKPVAKVKSKTVVAKKEKQITNQPDVVSIQSENIDANTETVSDSKNIDAVVAKKEKQIANQSDVAPIQSENIDAVKEVLPAQVTILFDYTYNRKRSRHLVEVSKVDGDVIYGFDLDRYEHLKFYLSDIKKEIVEINTGEIFDKEAWVKKFEHHTFECRDKSDISIAGGYGSYGVLFTGFSKKRRDELEDLVLRSERFFLRTKVCMGLDMLIVGPKPGPEKLRRAEEMGIPTMDEKTFIQMIDEFRQMKEMEYKKKMNSTKNFVYINASGKVSVHQVVNITEPDDSHLFGFSTIKERPVTYCKDRIIKEFSSLDEAQQYFDALSEDELNEIRSGYSIRVSSGVKRPAVNRSGLSCCFTGFKAADKERLVAFATEHEIRTVKKISSVTDFLVVCEDSKTIGQKKLAEAENFGVKVMFEDEFYYLLETGALGE